MLSKCRSDALLEMSSATASKCLCDNPSPARKLLVELSMSLVKSYVSLVVLKIRHRSVSKIILFTSKPSRLQRLSICERMMAATKAAANLLSILLSLGSVRLTV